MREGQPVNTDEEEYEEEEREAETASPSHRVSESAILIRELEIREKEKRLMERKMEIMRRELEMLRTTNRQNMSKSAVPVAAAEVELNPRPKVNINAVAELLPPFSGINADFDRWERQLRTLKETYMLEDKSMRLLIASRLKGKALDWLYSKSEYLEITVEQLLSEMKCMFRRRVSRLTVKKEFEERVWDHGEIFSEYLHDKVILGNKVPIDEEDIIEYIIKGIPDPWLRDHARIQRLLTKTDLLEAFEKIPLRRKTNQSAITKKRIVNTTIKTDKPDNTSVNITTRGSFRCYNCNGQGHVAKNCRQPKKDQTKKEETTCFSCGRSGHYARNCTFVRTPRDANEEGQIANVVEIHPEKENFYRNIV